MISSEESFTISAARQADLANEFVALTTTDDEETAALTVEMYEEYLGMSEEDRTEAYMRMVDNAATASACVLGLFEALVVPELNGDIEVEGIAGVAAEVLKWGISTLDAHKHIAQCLLEAYDFIIGDLDREADGTIDVRSIYPMTPSDVTQVLIDAAQGDAAEPAELTDPFLVDL
jgi:hypothetical protein